MTQPTRFTIAVNFADDEADNVGGRSTIRTAQLDAMAVAIQTTLDQILANLALIQRDDGRLLDGTVMLSTLASETRALLASTAWQIKGAWASTTLYGKGDVVLQGGIVYVCVVAHVAGVFATDLAAGDWGQVTANATAATTSFAPTATIAATNTQAAIQELDNEVRPVQSVLIHELFNGL